MKLPESKLVKCQKLHFSKTRAGMDMTVTVRHDDQCGNGHNSFSVTMDAYEAGKPHTDYNYIMGSCCHDVIVKYFPKLAHLIKWHLTSTDGPMHYIANTMYHAKDTDYNGLLAGEHYTYVKRVYANVTVGKPTVIYSTDTMYTNNQNNVYLEKNNVRETDALNAFIATIRPDIRHAVKTEPCSYSISKGKPHDLEAARKCAVWPEATLEQLTDETVLIARLPALMEEFRDDVITLGMVY